MLRMNFGFSLRPFGHVWILVIPLARDAMVFDPRVHAGAIRLNVRTDVIVIEVVTDVPIELPVIIVSGITLAGAPDLARTIRIASESRDSGRAIYWCVYAVARPFIGTGDAMRFQDGKADSFLIQESVQTGRVAALGKPETSWRPPESPSVMFYTKSDLRTHRRLVDQKQWQVGVCGGARQDVDAAQCLKPPEFPEQILPITHDKRVMNPCEERMVHARKRAELRIRAGAYDLLFPQFNQALESCDIARLKKR